MENIVGNVVASKALAYFGVHDYAAVGALAGVMTSVFSGMPSVWADYSGEYMGRVGDAIASPGPGALWAGVALVLAVAATYAAYSRLLPWAVRAIKRETRLTICTPARIEILMEYIRDSPQPYFVNLNHYRVVQSCERFDSMESGRGNVYPEFGCKCQFRDRVLEVRGHMVFQEVVKTQRISTTRGDANEEIRMVNCAITLYDNYDPLAFMEGMAAETGRRRTGTLYNVRYMRMNSTDANGNTSKNRSVQTRTNPMYSGRSIELGKRKSQFIDSFFSTHKRKWVPYLESVDRQDSVFETFGTTGKCNLLLHGPPGSGKSTFAYRIARYLHRHIVSLDLRDFMRDKPTLISVLSRASIPHPGGKYVVVLEEIDIAIRMLIESDKLRPSAACASVNHDAVPGKKMSQREVKIDLDSYDRVCDLDAYDRVCDLSLRDLLELFQGAVPNGSDIIIATTNNYEEMRGYCPELFRAGRFTPLHFDYMTRTEIAELTQFYFDRPLKLEHDGPIPVPTSELTEYCQYIMCDKGSSNEERFDLFRRFLETRNIR